MRRFFILSILLLCIIFFTGCAAHLKNPVDNTRSLVYGYMDMQKAPSKMEWGTIKQMKPKTDKPYWSMGTNGKGVFWHEQLPPGSYMLVEFGGHSMLRNANYTYNMPEYGKNETAVVIKNPGLYYLGTYQYQKGGSFFNPQFDIVSVDSPNEKEVLELLLPLSNDTEWEKRIEYRIGELEK